METELNAYHNNEEGRKPYSYIYYQLQPFCFISYLHICM